ncbi:hypothetical protein Pelo_19380 [Pelomyxa schiedti]|nr:hypothetical protein Pelo_19380 [Pelomyxa schiedti]
MSCAEMLRSCVLIMSKYKRNEMNKYVPIQPSFAAISAGRGSAGRRHPSQRSAQRKYSISLHRQSPSSLQNFVRFPSFKCAYLPFPLLMHIASAGNVFRFSAGIILQCAWLRTRDFTGSLSWGKYYSPPP